MLKLNRKDRKGLRKGRYNSFANFNKGNYKHNEKKYLACFAVKSKLRLSIF